MADAEADDDLLGPGTAFGGMTVVKSYAVGRERLSRMVKVAVVLLWFVVRCVGGLVTQDVKHVI